MSHFVDESFLFKGLSELLSKYMIGFPPALTEFSEKWDY
jgi:hypothetical protein